MTHHDVNAEQKTGTSDVTYDLLSVLYHALQGGETYAMYAKDAAEAGEREIADYFNKLVEDERSRAQRAKDLLKDRL